jgi:hypothetical protein
MQLQPFLQYPCTLLQSFHKPQYTRKDLTGLTQILEKDRKKWEKTPEQEYSNLYQPENGEAGVLLQLLPGAAPGLLAFLPRRPQNRDLRDDGVDGVLDPVQRLGPISGSTATSFLLADVAVRDFGPPELNCSLLRIFF